MAISEELRLLIRTEAGQAVRDLKRFQGEANQTQTSLKGLIGGLAKSAAGWLSLGVAIQGISRNLKESVELFRVQEEAELSLAAAIRATGKESEISAESITALASELQGVTTYGDEATIAAAALAQNLGNLSQQQLRVITPQIQDFASAMGMDLNSAAQLIGKTLGSSTNALARYGIEIDNSLTGSERLAAVSEVLDQKFGGFAETMGQTASAALTQYSNAMGDLKEQIGEGALGFFEPIVRGATRFVEEITAATQAARDHRDALADVGSVDSLEQINNAIDEQRKRLEEVQRNAEKMRAYDEETADRVISNEQTKLDLLLAQRQEIAAMARAKAMNAKGSEAAAAAAEAEAAAAKRHKENLQNIADAYARTKQGQIDALRAQIAYFEAFEIRGPRTTAIIADLTAQLDDMTKETEEAETAVRGLASGFDSYIGQRAAELMGQRYQAMADVSVEAAETVENRWDQAYSSMSSMALQTWGMINQLAQQSTQRRIDEVNKEVEAVQKRHELEQAWAEAAGATSEEMAALKVQQIEEEQKAEEEADKIKARLAKQQFRRDQALKVAQTLQATSLAMMQAYAQLGPIAGKIAATSIGIMGGIQLATINAQKPPAFERGGSFVTNGPQMIQVGDGQSPRERVTVEPLSGPYSRGGGRTNINIYITGVIDEEMAIKIKRAISDAEYAGVA